MAELMDYVARIRERIPEGVDEGTDGVDMPVLVVSKERLAEVLTFLRDQFAFDLLSDVSAVDWLPREPRYDVNYHLYSTKTNDRLRVKVHLPDEESPHIPSVFGIWPTADWHEREVFDFFGIVFDDHPDLKRILMPDEWIGHPLRKDYPVGGVPVEYRVEPAYVGPNVVPPGGRPAAGGVPARLRRDRGRPSTWTWTGP
ncbi:MAG TPA: NADH-quinone oxidoreductase subunit C, partial [Actinomycetota bacterium]|nr:NADH-quinone oxidoreductase subunit C [Actinomycetota bacterium]